MDQPVYKRILLKLSGEALAPANREDGILDFPFIDKVAAVLKKCREAGVFWFSAQARKTGIIIKRGTLQSVKMSVFFRTVLAVSSVKIFA